MTKTVIICPNCNETKVYRKTVYDEIPNTISINDDFIIQNDLLFGRTIEVSVTKENTYPSKIVYVCPICGYTEDKNIEVNEKLE